MAYKCSSEETRLQKKLIPLNIAVCILCLVASISLLVAPIITIDMGKVFTAITDVVDDVSDGYAEGYTLYVGQDGEEDGGSSDSGVDISMDKIMKRLAESMNGVKFSISTVRLGKMATSNDIVYELMGQIVNDISDVLTDTLISVAIPVLVSSSGIELTDEQIDTAVEKIKELDKVQSRAEAESKFGELLDVVGSVEDAELTDEAREKIVQQFGDLYQSTVDSTGGEFDAEKMLCVYVSENLLELETPVTSYEELLRVFLESNENGSAVGVHTYAQSTEDSVNEISSGFGEAMQMVRTICLIFFLVMMFFVLIWFIQALFALIRIFTTNKRFTMWYTKLVGFIPCLIFGVAPLVAGAVLASLVPEVASIIGAISSLVWISGACYVVLWGFSIFWAFPIKHKIRKLRKQEKAEALAADEVQTA